MDKKKLFKTSGSPTAIYRQAITDIIEDKTPNEKKVDLLEVKIAEASEERYTKKIKSTFFFTTLGVFIISNFFVYTTIGFILCHEKSLLAENKIDYSEVVINSTVVSSLIGATFVQVGAAFLVMAKKLFSQKS